MLYCVLLDHLVWEADERDSGRRTVPYWVEWAPGKAYDPVRFVNRLYGEVGRRAVEEFIDAIAHTRGPAAARPLREWWAAMHEDEP